MKNILLITLMVISNVAFANQSEQNKNSSKNSNAEVAKPLESEQNNTRKPQTIREAVNEFSKTHGRILDSRNKDYKNDSKSNETNQLRNQK